MKVMFGKQELEMDSSYLTWLKDSSHLLAQPNLLKERLEQDGYLLIRGFHDHSKVAEARSEIVQRMNSLGRLAVDAPVEAGLIGPENKGFGFRNSAVDYPAFKKMTDASKTLKLFEALLGGECLTYDTKWFRAVEQHAFSGAHYDKVYMGRGTENVYSVWSPLMEVPLELGGLAVCLGSQHFEQIKATYGQSDYEKVNGWFSNDPVEIVDRWGGQWATTHFFAGDMLIFGMYMMHGSLTNTTNRYRMSCDLRYQLKSEAFDPRWHGKAQLGDTNQLAADMIEIDQAKKSWGLV